MRGSTRSSVLVVTLALAAGAAPAATPLRFTTLDDAQGLSENAVTAIVEDHQGFLWIGTQNGLNRFDGLEFKAYAAGRDPTRELIEDYVNVLRVDRAGRLWIGTFAGGLSRYDPARGTFSTFLHDPQDPASLGHNDVSALHEAADGTLWVGTRGGGLQRLDPGSDALVAVALGTPDAPPAGNVGAIADAAGGGLWVGLVGAGLVELGPDRAPRRQLRADGGALGLPSDDVGALLRDAAGDLWIGTRRSGLARLDAAGTLRTWRHQPPRSDSLSHDAINALYQDRRGRIWIASAFGLDRYDAARDAFVHHRHAPGNPLTLPHDDVSSVCEDSNGTLWVGTGGRGVARHDEVSGQFELFVHDPGDAASLSPGGVWSVREGRDGSLWVGTFGGGLHYRAAGAGGFVRFEHDPLRPQSLSDNDVRALLEDRAGRWWIGTRRGLNRFDGPGAAFTHYFRDRMLASSLAHDFVRTLYEDDAGRIWVGTYGGGLDRYDPGLDGFVHYRNRADRADTLSDDRVYSLAQAGPDTLWVGTHGGGLNRLAIGSGQVERHRHDPRDPASLSSDRVLALLPGADGSLWVGTAAGLDRYDPRLGRFERQELLASDAVLGIVADAHGALWLSHSDGLVRYDPARAEARHFDLDGQLVSNEFNGGAASRGASGRIYFGGVEGLVAVTPGLEPERAPIAQPVLTELLAFNRPLRTRAFDPDSPLVAPIGFVQRVELAHGLRTFGFAFAALRTPDPARSTFAYRLDGFDDQWIETGAGDRTATFTNVPPGDYVFRVRATDSEGRWLRREARVAVRVLPAPWRTPWAYLGYALLLAGALTWALRARHRRTQQRRAAQREIAASEQRLSRALWGSGDELFEWDLGAASLTVVTGAAARQARVLHGLAASDDYARYVHPDDFAAFQAAIGEHLAGRSPHFEVSYRLRAAGGAWSWKLARGMIVARADDGTPCRVSGTQKDISRIKAVETALLELTGQLDARVQERTAELHARQHELETTIDELRRTQSELIEAEKMASLGRLVAGVAHEVNTPLGVGLTALTFLRDQLARVRAALNRHLQPEQTDALLAPVDDAGTMAESNLVRAANLVKSFKQVAVDQSSSSIRTVGVRGYLEGTLQSLLPALRKAGHRVTVECDAALEMTNRPDALYQVIANLVLNSIQHAYPDGRHGAIRIAVEADAGQLKLSYGDDGAGMDAAVARRVFEPFFTTKRGSGGSGLGLHIVYNLVTQALAGRIQCTTAPGQGVRFDVAFPRLHPQAARQAG